METAHKTDEEKKEYFDPEDILETKIEKLAQLIRNSKHFIAFTGAGISTSAGIPDFRSGINTILPTGPGAWEKLAQKQAPSKNYVRKSMQAALPTQTHMALVKLEQEGLLKFLISQNIDGLHRKSGFPIKKLSEVHGNTNLEICKAKNCKKQYMRDFRTRTAQKVHDHKTGRKCENCGGDLFDSIINFGEDLPEIELINGFGNSEKSDLCLSLGSSLKVTPAADMAKNVSKTGTLVIVNLQKTPLDQYALVIHAMIDEVITRLMKKLNLEIPIFILTRRLGVILHEANPADKTIKGKKGIVLYGLDASGSPYSIFPKIEGFLTHTKETFNLSKEPMKICSSKTDYKTGKLEATLFFQGHYNEPSFKIDVPLNNISKVEKVFILEYNPQTGKWINCFEKPK